jgi:tocopherol cyclase
MKIRLYNPGIFQGSLKKKSYFEGWYFKHVSVDMKHVYSIIPGISLNLNDTHAFIQIINGITGESEYIIYSLKEFKWDSTKIYLKIGDSVFTDKNIELNIRSENIHLTGHLEYSNIVKFPKSFFSPGIMGWYSFIPFMECKHAIISVDHDITGSMKINDKPVDFNGGHGYIEKDWGTSFPETWLWIQANNFSDQKTSFTFSVAKIPWKGKYFIGFIAFLYYNKKFFVFASYNNSELTELSHTDESIKLTLKNSNSIVKVITTKRTFGLLKAPTQGVMSRRIKESIDSTVTLKLYDKNNNLIISDISIVAGLEVIDTIFDYI